MIGMYLGGVEISDGIGIDRKVTMTAGAMANLTAQVATISSSDMTDILKASSSIMSPYPTGPLKITISCINIAANGTAKVKWSETSGGTKRTVGSNVTLPSALAVGSTQLLLSEVSYAYRPIVGYVITGTLTLSENMYMSPRISAPTYGTTACT
jgi:Flp pilus assembly protein TadG